MTTIVCTRDRMAGDTLATTEHSKSHVPSKVFTIKGWLVGYAGDYGHCMALIEELRKTKLNPVLYFQKRDPPPHIKVKKCQLLLVSPAGTIYHYEGHLQPFEVAEDYWAIGHDYAYALGAMAVGATVEEAVNAAIKHGTATGGKVAVRKLRNGKKG